MMMDGRRYDILGNIVVGVGVGVGGVNQQSPLVVFLGAVVFLLILRAIPGHQPFEH